MKWTLLQSKKEKLNQFYVSKKMNQELKRIEKIIMSLNRKIF